MILQHCVLFQVWIIVETMKRVDLVVNADDFGMSEEVNTAVIRAFQSGTLTSCSMMVSGEAFDQAVRLAKETPRLGVGIHLVTVMGRSVLPHSEIPSLVDRDGYFSTDPTSAGLKYYFSKKARLHLHKELTAQFERFVATRLPLSHIDSHLHMHVHPVVFDHAVELGESYGVRRMRLPSDDLWLALRFKPYKPFSKVVQASIFGLLTKRMRKKLAARGFVFPSRVFGHLMSGKMNEEYVLSILDRLKADTNEIYLHPAAHADNAALSPEELQHLREFNTLLSRNLAERLKDPRINLTSYSEMRAT